MWDSTNVVEPVVAVMTNVSEDHIEVLGPTLDDIAREKAGIIKSGATLVLGETDPHLADIFIQAAERVGASPVWRRGTGSERGRFRLRRERCGGREAGLSTFAHQGPLRSSVPRAPWRPPRGQRGGSPCRDRSFLRCTFGRSSRAEALGAVRVPGRLEPVSHSPLVLLDGAHNLAGAQALARSISGDFAVDGPVVAVVGLLSGRNAAAMLRALVSGGVSRAVMCPAPSPRALPVSELLAAAASVGLVASAADSVVEACEMAVKLAGQSGLVVVTGSLYVVGKARTSLFRPPEHSTDDDWSAFSGIPEIDGHVPRVACADHGTDARHMQARRG